MSGSDTSPVRATDVCKESKQLDASRLRASQRSLHQLHVRSLLHDIENYKDKMGASAGDKAEKMWLSDNDPVTSMSSIPVLEACLALMKDQFELQERSKALKRASAGDIVREVAKRKLKSRLASLMGDAGVAEEDVSNDDLIECRAAVGGWPPQGVPLDAGIEICEKYIQLLGQSKIKAAKAKAEVRRKEGNVKSALRGKFCAIREEVKVIMKECRTIARRDPKGSAVLDEVDVALLAAIRMSNKGGTDMLAASVDAVTDVR